MDKMIYLIRHGQTDLNKKKIVQGSGVDSSLNETGRQQAQAFFNYYEQIGFDLLISSALKRTHETIAPFIQQDIPWEQHTSINEMNWGIHEGKPSEPQMRQHYLEMIEQWKSGNFDARLEEGESAQELADRLSGFLQELKVKEAQKVLVCSHGRSMRCLMCLIKDQHLREMETYNHRNTCLFIINQRNGAFDVVLENDLRHLNLLRKKCK